MQGFAVFLALASAACLYLAAPNQVLLAPARAGRSRRPGPRIFGWLGFALALLSTALWSLTQGWPVAIAATLATVPTALSFWPFVGAFVHQKRRASAGRQAS